MKPILFNIEMVRAILDGMKTQTRRLVKNIPLQEPYFEVVDGTPYACDGDGEWHSAVEFSPIQKGDVLYVRETWTEMPYGFAYRADGEEPDGWDSYDRWYPSIHMPKEAARLFLRVTGVRCERLQDMTPEDCANDGGFEPYAVKTVGIAPLFGTLWDSTVKKDAIKRWGWDANPWVWVIEFERCEKP
jgi:hypothetical protein